MWVRRIAFAVKFHVLGQKRVALASFPRSGNTWLRHLLETATGQQTGTIYSREAKAGLIDQGVVVKTHMRDSYRYTRCIHLVRNPFDCIESLFFWSRDCSGRPGNDWNEFVRKQIVRWTGHSRHWLGVRYDVIRIRYEDLHADPVAGLGKVLEWLGRPIDRAAVVAAVEACGIEKLRQRSDGEKSPFYRRGEIGRSFGSFTREQREHILACAGDLIQVFGYETICREAAEAPFEGAPDGPILR